MSSYCLSRYCGCFPCFGNNDNKNEIKKPLLISTKTHKSSTGKLRAEPSSQDTITKTQQLSIRTGIESQSSSPIDQKSQNKKIWSKNPGGGPLTRVQPTNVDSGLQQQPGSPLERERLMSFSITQRESTETKWTAEIKELKDENAKLVRLLGKSSEEISQLQGRLVAAESQSEKFREDCISHAVKLEKINKLFQACRQSSDSNIRKQFKHIEGEFVDPENQMIVLVDCNKELQIKNSKKNRHIRQLENEKESASQKAADESNKITKYLHSIEQYNDKNNILIKKNVELDDQNKSLLDELDKTKKLLTSKQVELEKTIQESEKEKEKLKNKNKKLNDKIIFFKSKLNTKSKQLDNNRRSSLTQQEEEQKLESWEKSLEKTENEQNKRDELAQTIEKEGSNHKKTLQDKQRYIDELQSKIHRLQKELDLVGDQGAQALISNLKDKNNEQKAKISEQKKKIHDLASDRDRLVETLSILSNIPKPELRRMETETDFSAADQQNSEVTDEQSS